VTPNLVGRDRELAVLAGLVDGIGERGGAVVVLGEAGAGKSSLLMAMASRGRDAGLQVLEATGVDAEAQPPFAGLRQLLRPVLGALTSLPDVQRRALGAALGAEPAAGAERYMIALAALNLIADAAAATPVLVLADDVHWLDRPTQEVLAFLARRISADPVVLAAASRHGHDGPLTSAGLAELQVGHLDGDSARRLLLAHAGDLGRADLDRILTEAQGNPLALIELPAALRAAAAGGPDLAWHALPLTTRLERAFAARRSELPQPARDALLIVAVDAADDVREILAGTALLAGARIGLADLEPAAAAGLIRFDGRLVRFRHPLVRSAVMAAESPARRAAANRALAEVLGGDPYRSLTHRARAVAEIGRAHV